MYSDHLIYWQKQILIVFYIKHLHFQNITHFKKPLSSFLLKFSFVAKDKLTKLTADKLFIFDDSKFLDYYTYRIEAQIK